MIRAVQAAACVLLRGNAGEVLLAIIGSAVTGRSPLNTCQLLLVNMLTDGLPAAALAVSEPNGQKPIRRARPRPVGTVADGTCSARDDGDRRHASVGSGESHRQPGASIDGRARRADLNPTRSDAARLAQPGLSW